MGQRVTVANDDGSACLVCGEPAVCFMRETGDIADHSPCCDEHCSHGCDVGCVTIDNFTIPEVA